MELHKNITGFFKQIEVEGLGSGNIKKIMQAGFDTIPKIIAMKKADFLKIDGFKEKMAEKIYSGIKQKIGDISLAGLMTASNIFGRGFGERRFQMVLKEYPNILESDESTDEKINHLMKLDGFAKKTAEKFVEGISKFMEFIKAANLVYKLEIDTEIKKPISNHPLNGKKIVMTGFRDKALIKQIEEVGGEMGTSVSANTTVLLVKDKFESTGKVDQAKKHNISIMLPEEFIDKYFKVVSEVQICSSCKQPMDLMACAIDWSTIGFSSQCDNCCCGSCGCRKKEEGQDCC